MIVAVALPICCAVRACQCTASAAAMSEIFMVGVVFVCGSCYISRKSIFGKLGASAADVDAGIAGCERVENAAGAKAGGRASSMMEFALIFVSRA